MRKIGEWGTVLRVSAPPERGWEGEDIHVAGQGQDAALRSLTLLWVLRHEPGVLTEALCLGLVQKEVRGLQIPLKCGTPNMGWEVIAIGAAWCQGSCRTCSLIIRASAAQRGKVTFLSAQSMSAARGSGP